MRRVASSVIQGWESRRLFTSRGRTWYCSISKNLISVKFLPMISMQNHIQKGTLWLPCNIPFVGIPGSIDPFTEIAAKEAHSGDILVRLEWCKHYVCKHFFRVHWLPKKPRDEVPRWKKGQLKTACGVDMKVNYRPCKVKPQYTSNLSLCLLQQVSMNICQPGRENCLNTSISFVVWSGKIRLSRLCREFSTFWLRKNLPRQGQYSPPPPPP